MSNNPQPLKDLVFKGAFFVILIYLLVYAYNLGIFNRLKKAPIENTVPAEILVPKSQVVIPVDQITLPESSPSNEFTQ